MRKQNRMCLVGVGFLLLLLISRLGAAWESIPVRTPVSTSSSFQPLNPTAASKLADQLVVPKDASQVQVAPCETPYDLALKTTFDSIQKKINENTSNHICFKTSDSSKLTSSIKAITIPIKDYLKVDGLNLNAKTDSTPFPLLSLTGTGTVEFENLQLTNAFTGIEVAAGITVKFTNSTIACGADPNSTGIRILSAIQNASIQDATINGCKIGIDDMGTGTSVLGGSFTGTNGVMGITATGSQGHYKALGISGFQTGIHLKGSAHTVTNIMISNATIGIDDIGTNASIFGGSLISSNGAIGIRSTSSGVTIDEGLAIKGFKEGIHLEGSNHLVAGINIACDSLNESTAITAKGTQIMLGPDITAKSCTEGIHIAGQQIMVSMNDLNKIEADKRIVLADGANNNIQPFVAVTDDSPNIWADKDRNSVKKIGGVLPVNGTLEAFFHVGGEEKAKISCNSTIQKRTNATLFECDGINLPDNKYISAWFTLTTNDGTSSASIEYPDFLGKIDAPGTGVPIIMSGPTGGLADQGDVTGEGDYLIADADEKEDKKNNHADTTLYADPGLESAPLDGQVSGVQVLTGTGAGPSGGGFKGPGCSLNPKILASFDHSELYWILTLILLAFVGRRADNVRD